MDVSIKVVKVAGVYIAMTKLGGLTIRGGTRTDQVQAVQSLFQVLGGQSGNTDDALLAVSLGLQGATIDEALQLPSAEGEQGAS